MHAAFHGYVDIVKLLLEKGADVKARGKNDVTALLLAEQAGHACIVDMLREEEGWTALTYAAWLGKLDAVRSLIAEGADVNAGDRKLAGRP